jgi:hypothetical protein
MRSILLAFIALSLWMPRANAQAAVLIGLHVNDSDGEGEHPPSYRTLLITFRDGKAQLAADLPDLIIPRRDGFWRAGTLHIGPPGKHRIKNSSTRFLLDPCHTPSASIIRKILTGIALKPTRLQLSLRTLIYSLSLTSMSQLVPLRSNFSMERTNSMTSNTN